MRSILTFLILGSYAHAEWREYNPPGCVNGRGILQDVLSRCKRRGEVESNQFAWDKAFVCHECTHLLNEQLTCQNRDMHWAYYVGGGRYMRLPYMRVSIQQVATNVPAIYKKTHLFRLHFSGRRSADSILCELVAACNGMETSNKLGERNDNDHPILAGHFADALVVTVKKCDPKYPALADLEAFVESQKNRAKDLVDAQTHNN